MPEKLTRLNRLMAAIRYVMGTAEFRVLAKELINEELEKEKEN